MSTRSRHDDDWHDANCWDAIDAARQPRAHPTGAWPGTILSPAPGARCDNRPISVCRSPRRALTLCPQLCMSIQPGARYAARSADALPATLYGHFNQVIYQNRPIAVARIHSIGHTLTDIVLR